MSVCQHCQEHRESHESQKEQGISSRNRLADVKTDQCCRQLNRKVDQIAGIRHIAEHFDSVPDASWHLEELGHKIQHGRGIQKNKQVLEIF
jgi:hypothetical protein